jgi:hypothetical protein
MCYIQVGRAIYIKRVFSPAAGKRSRFNIEQTKLSLYENLLGHC